MKPNIETSSQGVVTLAGVSRRYDAKLAMDNVTLEVPRGVVYGLVGENGAGKTTLIKHLMGLSLLIFTAFFRLQHDVPVSVGLRVFLAAVLMPAGQMTNCVINLDRNRHR